MKKWCLLLAALAATAWGQHPKAGKPPSLAGAWELVLDKSDFGRMPPPKSVVNVITHKEPFLEIKSTVELAQGKYSQTLKYRTTGAQDDNDASGATMTSWSKWFDNEFVIEGEVVAGNKWVRFKERWSLADGGKTLVNNRVMYMAGGEIPQKLVFARKGR